MKEDANGNPVTRFGTVGGDPVVRHLHYTGEKFGWHGCMSQMQPESVALQVNGWHERWNLCKLLQWWSGRIP